MRYFVLVFSVLSFSISTTLAQRECDSYSYYLRQTAVNPSFVRTNERLETFVKKQVFQNESVMSLTGTGVTPGSVIRIPVVVHILYQEPAQRIAEDQVRSQIEALNQSFRNLAPVPAALPDQFKSLASDCLIEFVLATIDPAGKPTRGIIWKKTTNVSFGPNDYIKFSRHGGDDAWDADQYLNIWVGKLSAGAIGYSSPLGIPKEKDGIVIRYTAFGTTGVVASPYNLGKTAVHETGHWLGLKHVWGDRFCGDDEVADTPPQKGPTQGCPTGIINSCDNSAAGSMYMNYMDVTYDACTSLFTVGQSERMRALFAEGGPRHALLFSKGISGPLFPVPVEIPVDTDNVRHPVTFPNPASSMVTIRTNDQLGQRLIIYDQLGKIIVQLRIASNTMQVSMDKLKDGLYYVKIGTASKPMRFVKID